MKPFVLKSSAFVCFCLLIAAAISTPSCKKDKTCRGKVTVLDTMGGNPVAGATVLLAAPSVHGQVTYTGVTDGSGVVNFEVKLPAIFDIIATVSNFPGDTAKGVLRLDEPGKSNEALVRMK